MTTAKSLTMPAGALDTSRRAQIIGDLNTSAAFLVDCHVSAKQAHWNIHGANFEGLHQLFDLIAEETREYSDLVAERIAALRGTIHATVHDVAAIKDIQPFPTDMQDWRGLTMALHERLMKTSERLRSYASSMDDELATQDIYVEIMRGLDKRAWMLEAHLSEGQQSR